MSYHLGSMRHVRLPLGLVASIAVWGGGCTRRNEAFCCLTLEECDPFDVDEIRECEPSQTCSNNACVPRVDAARSPDATSVDASPVDCQVAGGQIVFQTDRDGDDEIARVLADGTAYDQLTSNTWADRKPKLSPDGSRIAWIAAPAGEWELFVMNWDGSDPHGVSGGVVNPNVDAFRWSPDSTRLLLSTPRDGAMEIYVVNADGTGLANRTNNSSFDDSGDWSPDGSRIVFYTQRDTGGPLTGDLYTMNSDGTQPSAITATPGFFGVPRWAPSGSWIAHTRTEAAPGLELWLVSATGTNLMNLGVTSVREYSWSPDSSRIVFSTTPDVFTINGGGSGLVNLTNGTGANASPEWSPDGSRILFQSDRDGNGEIYLVELGGNPATNLTSSPGEDVSGSWGPCP